MPNIGVLIVIIMVASGCTAIFGEDPEVLKAQQTEQSQQLKHARMQADLERLRSEVRVKKIELESLK